MLGAVNPDFWVLFERHLNSEDDNTEFKKKEVHAGDRQGDIHYNVTGCVKRRTVHIEAHFKLSGIGVSKQAQRTLILRLRFSVALVVEKILDVGMKIDELAISGGLLVGVAEMGQMIHFLAPPPLSVDAPGNFV